MNGANVTSYAKTAFFAAIVFAVMVPSFVSAAAVGGQGFEISPPKYELKASPGQVLNTTVNLRNITQLPITATASFNDFTANDTTGNPSILPDGRDAASAGMRSWFQPIGPVSLEPGRLVSVPVTIRVPANASPGGHYGVVRFNSASGSTGSSSGVALSASVGTLYLITVSGLTNEKLELSSFTVSKDNRVGSFFQKAPVVFTEVFKNSGNVFVKPAGTIVVTDTFGKKVGQLDVNKAGGNILQDTEREFKQTLNGKLLGRYTAQMYVNYGDGKQLEVAKRTFWVVPWLLIIIIAIVIGILVMLMTRFRLEPRKRGKKTR